MKIYSDEDPIEDAVEALVAHGLVAVEGTTTSAKRHMDKVIAGLSPEDGMEVIPSYKNTKGHGYLYYVYDGNRFSLDESKQLVDAIAAANPA